MPVRTLGVAAAAAVLAGCGAAPSDSPNEVVEPSPVYRLTPEEIPHGDCKDPSCTLVRFVVWVAPEPGWARSEMVDGTGFETIRIFAHDSAVTDHNDGAPDVRSGLASSVGQPPELDVVEAVRARETLAPGDRIRVRYAAANLTFVVAEEPALDTAASRELFEIPDGAITSRTLEPGASSELVDAYWLGPRHDDLDVVTAIERDAPNGHGYFVFYGQGPDSADAFQIANEAANQVEGRRTLAALRDREQSEVVLANGERARLISISPVDHSYVVATRTTLIGFVAESRAEAIRLAEALRPVGSS